MEHIIHQILTKYTTEMMKTLYKRENYRLENMTGDVLSQSKAMGAEIVQAFIANINQALRDNKELRKQEGLVCQQKDRPREMMTVLGLIQWKRDYYYNKNTDTYVAPLDEMLEIDGRQRIGKDISAALLTSAASMSYAKSTRIVTGGVVSKQTVHDHILKSRIQDIHPSESPENIQELHIYADEDHVHLQSPKGFRGKKQCQIVPLVTITEGIKEAGKGRNQTINPMHFVDETFSTGKLWDSVSGYITANYHTESIRKICLHSDGGKWIQNGLETLPGVVRVMDGFHFYHHMKRLSNRFPNRNVKTAIISAIRNNDSKKAVEFLQSLENPLSKPVLDFETYLLGQWDMIHERIVGDHPGSCTEPLVSHVLSERFSRNPMGWSKAGLGKLSKIRVFLQNGGTITSDNFRSEPDPFGYASFFEKLMDGIQEPTLDWSIFDCPQTKINPSAPIQKLIHHIIEPKRFF